MRERDVEENFFSKETVTKKVQSTNEDLFLSAIFPQEP